MSIVEGFVLFLVTTICVLSICFVVYLHITTKKNEEMRETDEQYCERLFKCEQESERLKKVYIDWKKNRGKPWRGC